METLFGKLMKLSKSALQYFKCGPVKIPVENEDKTVLIF